MDEELENPTTTTTSTAAAAAIQEYSDDIDSGCSTPYVSAPSSPGRGAPLAGFYYSAPASPTHFILSTTTLHSYPSAASAAASDSPSPFDFDFSAATFPATGGPSSPEPMSSADELFFNGQIRPMTLTAHLHRPQILAPLIESEDVVEDDPTFSRGRELKFRAGSLRRRSRSMSPNRTPVTTSFRWQHDDEAKKKNEGFSIENVEEDKGSNEATPCGSRSSSAGRSSRRWVFLKEFLYRSKSEGRSEAVHKFWGFSRAKDKKMPPPLPLSNSKVNQEGKKKAVSKNGGGKRRGPPPSAHELHYAAKRAQAEEMRKKTFLPYRQGLLGCLGFGSKSYGAINGFARALNSVSSR